MQTHKDIKTLKAWAVIGKHDEEAFWFGKKIPSCVSFSENAAQAFKILYDRNDNKYLVIPLSVTPL